MNTGLWYWHVSKVQKLSLVMTMDLWKQTERMREKCSLIIFTHTLMAVLHSNSHVMCLLFWKLPFIPTTRVKELLILGTWIITLPWKYIKKLFFLFYWYNSYTNMTSSHLLAKNLCTSITRSGHLSNWSCHRTTDDYKWELLFVNLYLKSEKCYFKNY